MLAHRKQQAHRVTCRASLAANYVVLANTALSATRPRRTEISRDDAAAMIQLFCKQTNIWPSQPTSTSG